MDKNSKFSRTPMKQVDVKELVDCEKDIRSIDLEAWREGSSLDYVSLTKFNEHEKKFNEHEKQYQKLVVPVQCQFGNYYVLDDPLRSVLSPKTRDIICDTTDVNVEGYYNNANTNLNDHGWRGNAWYKFEGDAGTIMPINPTPNDYCGTSASGWLATTHPTMEFETIPATYCFRRGADNCKWHTQGLVTNCGDSFVYYLVNVATEFPEINKCHIGYCVTKL